MPVGTVEKMDGKYVMVKMERQDMCGECHACEMLTDKKSCSLKCTSQIKCQEGDRVEVSLGNETFLKATYIMYGLPFIGLIIGLALGYLIQSYLCVQWGEILCVIMGLIGMGIMLAFIYIRDRKNAYKKYLPHITAKQKLDTPT